MTTVIKMACNYVSWPCGCSAWHEWKAAEPGEWAYKRWLCFRHESSGNAR